MSRTFSFQDQMNVGMLGVQITVSVLRRTYPNITNLQDDMEQQRRGIDLYVEGLGYLEVKTDSHSPARFFFEIDVGGKPGAVDRCSADYYCVLFYKHRMLCLIPRPELQKWLRENYALLVHEHPNWVRTIRSRQGRNTWSAKGIIVPRKTLSEDVDIRIITWQEEDEVFNITGKGGNLE